MSDQRYQMLKRLGEVLFRYRSFTPIPFVILLFFIAQPSLLSIGFGSSLLLVGLFLRILSVRYVGKGERGREVGGERLVIGGPYRHLRNPVYLGNFILSLGFIFFAAGWKIWVFPIFILFFFLQYTPIVLLEERVLRERFGEEYERYFKEVPRFIPKIYSFQGRVSVTESQIHELSWRKAIRSERSTLLTVFLLYSLFLFKGLLINSIILP